MGNQIKVTKDIILFNEGVYIAESSWPINEAIANHIMYVSMKDLYSNKAQWSDMLKLRRHNGSEAHILVELEGEDISWDMVIT